MPTTVAAMAEHLAAIRLESAHEQRLGKQQASEVLSEALTAANQVVSSFVTPSIAKNFSPRRNALDPPTGHRDFKYGNQLAGVVANGPKALVHLGDQKKPIKILQVARQDLLLVPNEETRALIELVDARLSSAAFAHLIKHDGPEGAAKVGARLMHEVLRLRAQARTDARLELQNMLLVVLNLVLKQTPAEALRDVSLVPTHSGLHFSGEVAFHAAYLLDCAGLDAILLARRIFAKVCDDPDAPPIPPDFLIAALFALCTSPLAQTRVDDATTTLRRLLSECDDFFKALPAHDRLMRYHSLRHVVTFLKFSPGLPVLLEEAQKTQARTGDLHNDVLNCTANNGWFEATRALLHAGIRADARSSEGIAEDFAIYCFGPPALAAALMSTTVSDATSIQVAKLLLQHGASLATRFVHPTFTLSRVDLTTIQEALERHGLARRWDMLRIAEPRAIEEFEAQADQEHLKIEESYNALFARTCNIAQDSLLLEKPSALGEVLASLQDLFQLFLQGAELFRRNNPSVEAYLNASAAILAERVELTQGFSPALSMGQSEADKTMLVAWAQQAALLQPMQKFDGHGSPYQDMSTGAWLNELAEAQAAGLYLIRDCPAFALVLFGKCDEASHLLKVKRHQNLKNLYLAFFVTISGQQKAIDQADKTALELLAHEIVGLCRDAATLRALADACLRVGSGKWLTIVMDHGVDHKINLSDGMLSDVSKENLLHVAAGAPSALLKALAGHLAGSTIVTLCAQQDEMGDTPMHRAARCGLAHIKTMTRLLDTASLRAVLRIENISGRNSAIEALTTGHLKTFSMLSNDWATGKKGASLVAALTARRALIDAPLVAMLLQNDASKKLLLTHAPRLARKLAVLGDIDSLEALLTAVGPDTLLGEQGHATVLHGIAHNDDIALLHLLQRHASADKLHKLAHFRDKNHQLAEDHATEPALQAALRALRGEASDCIDVPRAKGTTNLRGLKKALRHLAQDSQSAKLEASIRSFCLVAKELLQQRQSSQQSCHDVYDLAWRAIEHVDRAPTSIGMRMGVHFAVHRPEVSDAELMARCLTTKSGASRFGYDAAIALLEARCEAVAKALKSKLASGLRMTIDVAVPNLSGAGFKAEGSAIVPMSTPSSVRAVFAQTHQGLLLITLYPVAGTDAQKQTSTVASHRGSNKRRAKALL